MSNTPPEPELSEESPPTDSRRRAVQKAVETFLRHVRRVVTHGSPATDAAPTPVVVTDGGQADAKVIGHNQASGQTVGVWGEVDSSDGCGFATPDDVRIDGALIGSSLTSGKELTNLTGSGLAINSGSLEVTGGSSGGLWEKQDNNLLTPADSGVEGIDVDSATLDGTIDTSETDFIVEAGTPTTGYAQNVVLGHASNTVADGAAAVTIAGGGFDNGSTDDSHVAYDDYGTIGGGYNNQVGTNDDTSQRGATVAGGIANTASSPRATVGGGIRNTASGVQATVGGGDDNTASGFEATVGGGNENTASGDQATVGGGKYNTASGNYATVAGGVNNTASGSLAMIPGGEDNEASGEHSFAAGNQALATKDGSFVWNGSEYSNEVESPASSTFSVQANNGIWLGAGSSPSIGSNRLIDTSTGAYLSDGGTWTDSCSVTEKERFTPTDSIDVLEKVDSLEVSTWQYRDDDGGARHMGPTAEQFHDTFGLGDDAHHIAPLDTAGVALAAIQELSTQIDTKDDRIDELQDNLDAKDDRIDELQDNLDAKDDRIEEVEAENDELRERLADIEAHLGLDDPEISTDD